MGTDKRAALFNVLTIVMLVATVCLVGFYAIMGLNIYNPFPPPTIASVMSPLETPTPSGPTAIPTWTPTSSPTATSPRPTRTPTLTPSATTP